MQYAWWAFLHTLMERDCLFTTIKNTDWENDVSAKIPIYLFLGAPSSIELHSHVTIYCHLRFTLIFFYNKQFTVSSRIHDSVNSLSSITQVNYEKEKVANVFRIVLLGFHEV